MQQDTPDASGNFEPDSTLPIDNESSENVYDSEDDSETDWEQTGWEQGAAPRGRFFRDDDQPQFVEWCSGSSVLELEIGSGKGLFLTNAAIAHPHVRYVGLEIAAKYAWECQARIEKKQIANAKFFACDACAVVDQDVADESLDAVHVYFPDPWWKAKHKKRRVLNEQTLKNIERCLKPGGQPHFWTDVLDYYELTLELIDNVTTLQGPYFVSEPSSSHDMEYRTHFERRTRRNGLPVYRSRFEKRTAL